MENLPVAVTASENMPDFIKDSSKTLPSLSLVQGLSKSREEGCKLGEWAIYVQGANSPLAATITCNVLKVVPFAADYNEMKFSYEHGSETYNDIEARAGKDGECCMAGPIALLEIIAGDKRLLATYHLVSWTAKKIAQRLWSCAENKTTIELGTVKKHNSKKNVDYYAATVKTLETIPWSDMAIDMAEKWPLPITEEEEGM